MALYDKPVRLLLRDMVKDRGLDLGQTFDRERAIEWFKERYPLLLLAPALLLALGCGGEQQAPTQAGTVRVLVSFTGTGTDQDGPVVTLDGAAAHHGVGHPVVFDAVPAGDHTVELASLSARCIRAGTAYRTVAVAVGQTVDVSYTADCRDIDQLAFVTYRPDVPGGRSIAVIDADGQRLHDVFDPRDSVAAPAWAPDGRRLAFVYALAPDQPLGAVWVVNADGTGLHRLWRDATFEIVGIAWSPDGSRLAIQAAQRTGGLSRWGTVFVVALDSTSVVELPTVFGDVTLPSWAPDGSQFVMQVSFLQLNPGDSTQTFEGQPQGLFVLNRDGSGAERLPITGFLPAWSPEGSSIAVGQLAQIAVIHPDGSPAAILPCPSQCFAAAWSPDGTELATIAEDAIRVAKGDGSGAAVVIPPGTFWAQSVSWSPSGRYLAWTDTGASGITIIGSDGIGPRHLTYNGSGLPFSFPAWRP
jgi:hypothetical protein